MLSMSGASYIGCCCNDGICICDWGGGGDAEEGGD
jgi:hypothetical protein